MKWYIPILRFFYRLIWGDKDLMPDIQYDTRPPPPLPAPVVPPEPESTPVPEPEPEKPPEINYGKWKKLVKAIIAVESGGYDHAIGDKHLVDRAYGPMQIRRPVCIDVNNAYQKSLKPADMLGNRQLSIDTFYDYMALYATDKRLGRPVTDQDRARIWNGGPSGWNRPTTAGYWAKVKKVIDTL